MPRFGRFLWLLAVAGASSGACGRTPVELCVVPGAIRPCVNACGEGEERCIDGTWTTCDAEGPIECLSECGVDSQGVAIRGLQACSHGLPDGPCVVTWPDPCSTVCGEGTRWCTDGTWSACDAPQPHPPSLEVTVRDFLDSHPDFEVPPSMQDWLDLGVVGFELGADEKPVYAGAPSTPSTTGAAEFAQWYRDVPGINLTTTIELELTELAARPGVYAYHGRDFFPIDGELFGNQGRPHNYHFTVEVRSRFRYVGGEQFTFEGDDDLWVFINRRLAIDLGGVHRSQSDTVHLDLRAAELGLTLGGIYDLHLFFAERHTVDSNFSIETTIAEWDLCE